MEISDVKQVLNEFLIKTNFEEHGHVKYYKVCREDLVRLCIKLIKLIDVNLKGLTDYNRVKMSKEYHEVL